MAEAGPADFQFAEPELPPFPWNFLSYPPSRTSHALFPTLPPSFISLYFLLTTLPGLQNPCLAVYVLTLWDSPEGCNPHFENEYYKMQTYSKIHGQIEIDKIMRDIERIYSQNIYPG